jgi:hypothetical protein
MGVLIPSHSNSVFSGGSARVFKEDTKKAASGGGSPQTKAGQPVGCLKRMSYLISLAADVASADAAGSPPFFPALSKHSFKKQFRFTWRPTVPISEGH